MKMKSKYLKEVGISMDSSYEDIRRVLIHYNFVLAKLFAGINMQVENLKKGVVPSFSSVEEEGVLLESLLNTLYAQWFMGGYDMHKHFQEIIIARRSNVQIKQKGIYVRYHPNLSKKEWIERYENARELAGIFKVYKNMKKKDLPRRKHRKQVGTKDLEQNLQIYLRIERKVSDYWQDRLESEYIDPATNKPMPKLPVIESILEELLDEDKINDEDERLVLRKKYKNIYYEVAKRYMLPKYTDYPKFLEIIGL